ncbi:MAG: hypothetical protein ACYSWO_13260 [Planctomycetota bacterium]|jgi:hypothetical protein
MTGLQSPGRNAVPLMSQTVITDERWHHIGLVWDGVYRTLSVDNVAVAEDTQDSLEDSLGSSTSEPAKIWHRAPTSRV